MAKDKPVPPTRSNIDPSHREEQVRMRAFELYEERGCGDGRELEDWLRAEAEIANGKAKAKAV